MSIDAAWDQLVIIPWFKSTINGKYQGQILQSPINFDPNLDK